MIFANLSLLSLLLSRIFSFFWPLKNDGTIIFLPGFKNLSFLQNLRNPQKSHYATLIIYPKFATFYQIHKNSISEFISNFRSFFLKFCDWNIFIFMNSFQSFRRLNRVVRFAVAFSIGTWRKEIRHWNNKIFVTNDIRQSCSQQLEYLNEISSHEYRKVGSLIFACRDCRIVWFNENFVGTIKICFLGVEQCSGWYLMLVRMLHLCYNIKSPMYERLHNGCALYWWHVRIYLVIL